MNNTQVRLPAGLPAKVTVDHPYPRAFVTVSGAHLYGFPSADSGCCSPECT